MSLPTVWPTLRARQCAALMDFYERAFGFTTTLVVKDGDVVAHAEMTTPFGSGLMLGDHRENSTWPLAPGSAGIYLVADDVDGFVARALSQGATLIEAIHESPPGQRQATLADPEGNLWAIGTYEGTPA